MSSLTLLDQGEFSDVYIENLYVDNVYADQSGQTTFNDPVYIGNDTLEQHIRNQISVAGALTYNASSGLIGGITIDNVGHNVSLSITANTILSADVGGAIQSKWTLDFTANVLYPAVATTGIVAVNDLVVSGGATINSGLFVSGATTIQVTGGDGYVLTLNSAIIDYGATPSSMGIRMNYRDGNNIGNATIELSNFDSGGGVENNRRLNFGVSNTSATGSALMTIVGNGNVGIGNTAPNSTLTVSGNMGLSGAMTISGTLNVSGNVNITGSVSFNNGISVSGNATYNNNVFINSAGGIGIGQQPIGGVHRLATKGRIRANAYDAVDSSGVLELVSNGGIIDYLYSADNGKAYFDGTSDGLNVQIGLSANAGLEVAGSSVHNAGIYVVGGSEINGTLLVNDRFRVLGSATFTNTSADIGVPIRGHQGLFITGAVGVSNKIYSQGLAVSGASSFDSGGLTITGGALNVIGISSVGDITLARNNSASVGRVLTFTFGTGNAGAQAQGIEFRDLTTPAQNLGVYGSQNTLRFYSAGTEKMSIGANVDFATAPFVGGDQINTSDVLEVGNLYYTDARFDTRFATKTTTNLAEGTNLYYTDSRARLAISGSRPLVYDNSTGIMTLNSNMTNVFNNRIAIPNEFPATSFSVGFGSWNNNDSLPWADCMSFNTWADSSGGLQNFVAFRKDTVPSMRIYQGTFNDSVAFSTYRDAVMANSSGNVGIGTNSPTARLHLTTGNVGNPILLRYNNTVSEIYSGCDNTSGPWFGTSTNHNLRFTTNGTARMIIDTAGNVSIAGTTTPSFPLDVIRATDTTIRSKSNSTTGYAQLFVQANGLAGAGLYLNGSAGIAEGGANTLVIKNNMGGVIARNNSLTGGICITGLNGNVGINYLNATATLDIVDNLLVRNTETTSAYDNDYAVLRTDGVGYNITELGSTESSGIGCFNITGSVPIIYYSNASTDGSLYISNTSSVANWFRTGGGVNGVAGFTGGMWRTGEAITVDFDVYIKQFDGIYTPIVYTNVGSIGFQDNSGNKRLLWDITSTDIEYTGFNFQVNTWYAITVSYDAGVYTMVVNGTNYNTVSGGLTPVATAVSAGNHRLGFKTAALSGGGYIYYLNNYRFVRGKTSPGVQDARPLSVPSSGRCLSLVRVVPYDGLTEITRASNIENFNGLTNGTQNKVHVLYSKLGFTTTAGAVINTFRFRKNSDTERLMLHWRFSAFNNITGTIFTTYFYIYTTDEIYTNLAPESRNQWYGAAFAQRLVSSGCMNIPDTLPVGTYYIRFTNPAGLTIDTNDIVYLYLEEFVKGVLFTT
jgi:hypothetical protein